jgi:hypothetical protein
MLRELLTVVAASASEVVVAKLLDSAPLDALRTAGNLATQLELSKQLRRVMSMTKLINVFIGPHMHSKRMVSSPFF